MLDADVEVDRRDFTVRAALTVAAGGRLALFGPSGAGKTTVLEAIAGLVPLRRGQIALAGRVLTSTTPARALPPWQRRVGLLRQDPGLFPHLSVRDNLGYAPTAPRQAGDLAQLAGTLEIGGLLDAMPARLSGGQQHRVALGRLLLADCDALLLDEPYSGLDAALRRSLTDLVIRLTGDRQIPAIMVAHELPDAQAFAGQLAVIDAGLVLQAGPPHEVVLHPASRRVAELVGYLGFVPVRGPLSAGASPDTAGASPGATVRGPVSAGASPVPATVAGIHPDRVIVGEHPDRGLVLSGAMTGLRPSGAGWEADLRIGDELIVTRLPGRPEAPAGQLTVTAVGPPCFGPDGAALPRPDAPAAAPHGLTLTCRTDG